MKIFDDIETIFDNWKDSPGDLTFETLITILTIENLRCFTDQPLKSMVFPNSDAMVNNGFDLEKDLKMRIIVTEPILRQLCILFKIPIILLLVNFWCE